MKVQLIYLHLGQTHTQMFIHGSANASVVMHGVICLQVAQTAIAWQAVLGLLGAQGYTPIRFWKEEVAGQLSNSCETHMQLALRQHGIS